MNNKKETPLLARPKSWLYIAPIAVLTAATQAHATLQGDIETIGTAAVAFFTVIGGLGVAMIGYRIFKRLVGKF